MVFADIYLQPDAPDPVLDEQVVVQAARRHVADAGRLLTVDESGGEARAYFLEGGLVVKTQRPHRLRPRTSLAKEAFFLVELHRWGDFPVPRVLGHGEVEGIEYLCLTRIPGSALLHTTISPEERRRVLTELGRTLRMIHLVDQSAFEASALLPGDRQAAESRARIAAAFERLAAAFDSDTELAGRIAVRRIAEERLAVAEEDTEPVSLHSNPGPEHTFVDPSTGGFSGLIDFGDAYRSHPAFDFRPWPDHDDAEAVFGGYLSGGPLPPSFDETRRTILVIGALNRAVRGQVAAGELEATLDRLLG